MARTPDEIMTDFDLAIKGQSDVSPYDLLFEVIEDIIDSCKLYLDTVKSPHADDLVTTLRDYASNNYGD